MTLVRADAAQKRERDVLAHSAWGQKLTPAQFVEREEQLRAHPWCVKDMDTWFLVDETGAVLSSCETFRIPSRHHGKPGNTYGIASVFTEEKLRGRGHAVRMIDELMETLLRTDGNAQASILFSDVGARIYGRSGFHETDAVDWVFPTENARLPIDGVQLLDEREVPRALERLVLEDTFIVVPSSEQVDWHLERERIYRRILGRDSGLSWRVALGSLGGAATWALNVKGDELVVLTLSSPDDGELRALLLAAQRVGASCGVNRVRLWETPDLVGRAPPFVSRAPRDGSLPMLRPLHAKVEKHEWRYIPRALWL